MWEINTGGKNCYCATSKNVPLGDDGDDNV